jgi:hypothetical protein
MRHFKLPLIVTGVAVTLVMVIGLATLIWIGQLPIPNRQKADRAAKLGAGAGVLTGVVVAPFWIVAAAKVGKERRAARETRR